MISPQEQIKKLQLLLLKYDIHLFPQGFENSEEQIKEIIQIIKEDQEFNDNLQCEVDKFQSFKPQSFLQILEYDTHVQIKEEYNIKLYEHDKIQAFQQITETLKDIAITQAYIHINLIRDNDRIKHIEGVNEQLNQIRAQAIQEINNMESSYFQEIKSIKNPPPSVAKVAEIIVLLLSNSPQSSIWISFKQLIANPYKQFTSRLVEFKIEEVSQTPLTYARNAFERLNSDQMSRCNWCAFILHKWIQYQFQIVDILNINQGEVEEFSKHQKALNYQEKIKEQKEKLQNLEKANQEYLNFKNPLMQDKQLKAEQVIACLKQFYELRSIVKPKQYGVKFTKYIIKFLKQQYPQAQINELLDDIMTNIFPTYKVQYEQISEKLYSNPFVINNYLNQNENVEIFAHKIFSQVRNPISFYHNLKRLNQIMDKAALKEEIISLVLQMYLNEQKYSEQFLQDILMIIHQFLDAFPDQIEFNLHYILKIMNEYGRVRYQVIRDLIQYIEVNSKINLKHIAQFQLKGIPLIEYWINLYLEDGINEIKLKFDKQQLLAISEIILKQKLQPEQIIEIIQQNYSFFQKCQEQYKEVNKGIENIQIENEDNKLFGKYAISIQIVTLKKLALEYNELLKKVKGQQKDLFFVKKSLEDQLSILKEKDLIIREQIDKYQKILSRPIHQGIKVNELKFFKRQSKFNPITYFASKITLIQLGIYSYTPDMIKHIGTQSSLKKLKNLTMNDLNENQQHYLELLLTDFNDRFKGSLFQAAEVIQNLIKRTFRIFHLKQQKASNTYIQRSDLLEKQRILINKINIINQIRQDLEKQVIQKFQDSIQLISKNLELCEAQEKKVQKCLDQFQDMQLFQEFINKIQFSDTIDLCLSLIHPNYTIQQEKEVQLNKQKNLPFYLTQLQYDYLPIGSMKYYGKFNLLLMYLQVQYENKKVELKQKFQNKGLLDEIEMPILVDSLSYWYYVNTIAKTNLNILIGIYSFQLFYDKHGQEVQAICIQSNQHLTDLQQNTNYQIRVLYEILHIQFGRLTLSVILKFLQQVIVIQPKISNIYDVLNHQINIEAENQIQFKEFQKEILEMLNCQIKEFII
ncbi:hypothetical protein pb186bvf_002229 [Paramecium bursaria]